MLKINLLILITMHKLFPEKRNKEKSSYFISKEGTLTTSFRKVDFEIDGFAERNDEVFFASLKKDVYFINAQLFNHG